MNAVFSMQAELHLSCFDRINELETEVKKCHNSLNRAADEQKVNEKRRTEGGEKIFRDFRHTETSANHRFLL